MLQIALKALGVVFRNHKQTGHFSQSLWVDLAVDWFKRADCSPDRDFSRPLGSQAAARADVDDNLSQRIAYRDDQIVQRLGYGEPRVEAEQLAFFTNLDIEGTKFATLADYEFVCPDTDQCSCTLAHPGDENSHLLFVVLAQVLRDPVGRIDIAS